ncbi:ammonium transporter [Hyphomicrobium sp. CS1BSMeth3]|uniref:ammonium transporter n=1 Tax=Hyphomicrobium sp. CS1BSMeth3 TaxID=1892844 RepID=UPI001FCD862A|nr:ammonium transporter [Hyphomicrobium sp. CS1BSMeth3]
MVNMTTALPALAQAAETKPTPTLNSGDTAWMLTSTVLVLMMTIPGLALFYSGMVRKKNALATVMQSFAAACLLSIVWMVVGYSIAFGDGGALNAYMGGFEKMFLASIGKESLQGTIPESVFATFQMTFAIITPALIAGAVADRMKFSSFLVFITLWLIFVYAPICHWVWGGGFLGKDGVLDFAGGTVVHINSGIAGLVAALVLGRRRGYGAENMAPHNLVYTAMGAAFLWVGWFGFNAGSAAAANDSAGMAMLVTQIAAAAAALAWMFSEWMTHGKPSILGIASGAVAGLVAITPAAGFVDPKGALVLGLAAGVVCFIASTGIKRALGYDDSLDVFGIHGIGGIVGALLTGVFAVEAIGGTKGVLEGNVGQLWIQFYGIVATIVWCAVATFVILMIIRVTMGLRVDEQTEVEGLDIRLHGEVVP